jgi:two-component sensor histidine kinase
MLPALIVQPISLVIHELAMNAVQHGALQHSRGKLHIIWNPEEEGVALQWIEVGGPAPSGPLNPGFGTVMINAVVGSNSAGALKGYGARTNSKFPSVSELDHSRRQRWPGLGDG